MQGYEGIYAQQASWSGASTYNAHFNNYHGYNGYPGYWPPHPYAGYAANSAARSVPVTPGPVEPGAVGHPVAWSEFQSFHSERLETSMSCRMCVYVILTLDIL